MNLSVWLPGLLDFLGKGLVVSAAAFAIAGLLRRASAAQRHVVWLGAVGVLLALPAVSVWRGLGAAPAAEADVKPLVVTVRILAPAPATAAPTASDQSFAEATGVSGAARASNLGWREVAAGLWGVGVVAGLAAQGRATLSLSGLRRRSRALVDGPLSATVADLAREAGVRRRVEWRVSQEAPVAMTWGWWRPVVLLPRAAMDWPRERLELVLRHELAHVARGDSFVRVLAGVACAAHWPNPLVWLAARRLRLAQEQACDDAVLVAGASAGAYAEELLAAARAWGGRTAGAAAVAMAEPSTLERRILGVLGVARRSRATRSWAVGAWCAAACMLAGCSTLRVGEREGGPGEEGVKPPVIAAADAGSQSVSESALPPRKDTRQVEVRISFIEVKGGGAARFEPETIFGGSLTRDTRLGAAALGYLSAGDSERHLRELQKRFTADVLSAPRVTVVNQNQATITVAQEMRHPSTFDAPPNELTTYETRNVGVEASVLPNILADGGVALDVTTVIREFEGFLGGPPSSGEAKGTTPAEGEILVPVFAESANSWEVVLREGQVAVLRADGKKQVLPANAPEWARKAVPPATTHDEDEGESVMVLIEAKVITPAGGVLAEP